MDPFRFETLVKSLILEQLGNSRIKINHRAKIRGRRSGMDHEIDISFVIDVAGTRILVILECKAYKRPVSVDDVLEFAARLDDIAAQKGILVATSGFTAGAKRHAESRGIALVQAHIGRWSIVRRALPLSPMTSRTFFFLDGAQVICDGDRNELRLVPIDERDVEIYKLTEAGTEPLIQMTKIESDPIMRLVFQIVAPAAPPGVVLL